MTEPSLELPIIKKYILDEFLPDENPDKLTAKTPLLSSGILDSLALLKVIAFLEERFGIHVAPHEADEEHFNTLDAIGALVASKQ